MYHMRNLLVEKLSSFPYGSFISKQTELFYCSVLAAPPASADGARGPRMNTTGTLVVVAAAVRPPAPAQNRRVTRAARWVGTLRFVTPLCFTTSGLREPVVSPPIVEIAASPNHYDYGQMFELLYVNACTFQQAESVVINFKRVVLSNVFIRTCRYVEKYWGVDTDIHVLPRLCWW